MRLIDGDALSEYLDKRRTYEIMDGRNRAYGKGVRDAMNDVDAAPAIDAIPVGWMRDKILGYASRLKSTETAALVRVMQMWQKEQEAR